MADPAYTPPKVWTHDAENGGRFAGINRPTSGAREEKELPEGDHPFQLYSLATPNGVKATIMFEELLEAGHSGAEYDAYTINIGGGDQFGSGFVAINPNSKIPALLDKSGETPVRIFESGAILVHLAEKFGALSVAALAISTPTRPRNTNTPSIAMRWRQSAFSMWRTSALAKAASSPAMTTPLRTSPIGPGSRPSLRGISIMMP